MDSRLRGNDEVHVPTPVILANAGIHSVFRLARRLNPTAGPIE